MKKYLCSLWIALTGLFAFLFGFLIRQPQINKLKKQVKLLQKNNSKLLEIAERQHNEFTDLLVQHKALKAFQFNKKSNSNNRLRENLGLQYAFKEYLELLLNRAKTHEKMSKEELLFFKSYEKVINGEKLSITDMDKIKNYIYSKYDSEIKKLKECEYLGILEKLNAVKI